MAVCSDSRIAGQRVLPGAAKVTLPYVGPSGLNMDLLLLRSVYKLLKVVQQNVVQLEPTSYTRVGRASGPT